jgi:hypothetical protein
LLDSNEVDHLLVGGFAVSLHGYPRATGDMAVWIAVHPENARKLVRTLHEFGFTSEDIVPELFMEEDRIVRLGEPPLRVELLTSISGVTFAEAFADRILAQIDGLQVNVISRQHLRQNKRASGRTKDLSDLEELDQHL